MAKPGDIFGCHTEGSVPGCYRTVSAKHRPVPQEGAWGAATDKRVLSSQQVWSSCFVSTEGWRADWEETQSQLVIYQNILLFGTLLLGTALTECIGIIRNMKPAPYLQDRCGQTWRTSHTWCHVTAAAFPLLGMLLAGKVLQAWAYFLSFFVKCFIKCFCPRLTFFLAVRNMCFGWGISL
jgi:hypothetical protein